MTASRRAEGTRPRAAAVAVVGVGNRSLGCDQIGPRVVDDSRGRYGPEVELLDAGTAAFALLDCIRGQDLMLVVDACRAGGAPGEIRVREMGADFHFPVAAGTGLHQIGPLETLAVARRLFPESLPRRLLFVLVETEGLPPGDLAGAIRRAVEVVEGEIARYRARRADAEAAPGDICS